MLRKKEVYTVCTPIPGFIPRQLAIDILHSHGEVITLNPLVLSHKQIKAPRDAAADEYFSTWYEITERIQYVPGLGRFGSGKLVFTGCFHDLPWGLQSHILVPMGVDLRNKYRIAGNQPGVEPPEHAEIGLAALGAPKDGLYLREDIEIRCNIAMVGLVKSQMKTASREMVQRIIKKAELLDAGVLQAMIEDGKMKTFNPNDKTYTGGLTDALRSPQLSPASPYQPPMSPSIPYQVPRPKSMQPQHLQQQQSRPGTAGSLGYPAHWQQQQQQQQQQHQDHQHYAELPSNNTGQQIPSPVPQHFVNELPGDFYHTHPHSQSSPHLQPPQPSPTIPQQAYGRQHSHSPTSIYSQPQSQPHTPEPRWSHSNGQPSPSMMSVSSRPTSYNSDPGTNNGFGGGAGYGSPALDHKGFAAELPTHRETLEEHGPESGGRRPASHQPMGQRQGSVSNLNANVNQGHGSWGYAYNPADYSRTSR
ncbi:Uu.00g012470.m01.CDS01 [Anthostomella pinea]|uniref:Uu.00g012470.m01.CDS01 n=1 Tax=Anthostomella pinea TaxID=933095 RepID=A0AAI8YQ57_9PEZI|nr:Uu.00g012470.m01.CDS01 [Anthostomella pinea]